jgi:hypothetical protein
MVFGSQKKSPSHQVQIADRTRSRARQLDGNTLNLQLEVMLNSTLPEVYTHWVNGQAPAEEVELALEAILACWDELATRQDVV